MATGDLEPPVCPRGRGLIWGERSMQSQDSELGVARAGVREREGSRLVPGFTACAPGQMVSVD